MTYALPRTGAPPPWHHYPGLYLCVPLSACPFLLPLPCLAPTSGYIALSGFLSQVFLCAFPI